MSKSKSMSSFVRMQQLIKRIRKESIHDYVLFEINKRVFDWILIGLMVIYIAIAIFVILNRDYYLWGMYHLGFGFVYFTSLLIILLLFTWEDSNYGLRAYMMSLSIFGMISWDYSIFEFRIFALLLIFIFLAVHVIRPYVQKKKRNRLENERKLKYEQKRRRNRKKR
ncbi:hypothetical protein ABFV99_26945 [Cytobacillus horneckiae]|uniref:hypothetical protein n=1 Tax=Cytobacillus horneckiae TaxID=549687 RepID=UPI0034CD176E